MSLASQQARGQVFNILAFWGIEERVFPVTEKRSPHPAQSHAEEHNLQENPVLKDRPFFAFTANASWLHIITVIVTDMHRRRPIRHRQAFLRFLLLALTP